MSASETKVFQIAGFEVQCKKQPYDDTGDRPITVLFRTKPDDSAARLLVNFIENQLLETTTSDSTKQASNKITFHNVYAGPNSAKSPADFDCVCNALENLSERLPQKLGLQELTAKLRRLEKQCYPNIKT